MPTTITHTVGTSGTRDYLSLSAWEQACRRDLVATDEIEIVECYNDGEMTDSVTIMGWTTDATHYIKIYAPPGQAHSGTIDTGFHIKYNSGYIFKVYSGNVIIADLELEYTGVGGTAASDGHIYLWPHSAETITVDNCLFESSALTPSKSLESIYHSGVPLAGKATWLNTGDLTGVYYVYALLAAADGSLYAGTYYQAGSLGKVFKSTDGGATWADTGAIAGANRVYCLLEYGGAIYAGTAPNGDVFKSTDGGATWNNTGDLAGATVVYSLLAASDGLYAGTSLNGDVFKSTDVGATWNNTGNLASATTVYSLLQAADGSLYAGTGPNGDVFKSTDVGTTWVNTGNLASATIVEALCEASDGTLYAGTGTNGDVFKSTNGGTTWTNTANLPNQRYVSSIIEATNGFIYVTTRPTGSFNGAVYFTNNAGVTWTNATTTTIQNPSSTIIPLFYQLIQHPTNGLLYVGCALQAGQGYVFKGVISTGGNANLTVTDNKFNWVNQDAYEAIATRTAVTETTEGVGTILIQNNTMVATAGGNKFVMMRNAGTLTQTGNTITLTGDVNYGGTYDFEGALTIANETLTFLGGFNTAIDIEADSAAQAIDVHACTINLDGTGNYACYIEVTALGAGSTINIYQNNILAHAAALTKEDNYGLYIYDELGVNSNIYRNKIFSTGDGVYQEDAIYIYTDGGIVKLYNNMIANFYRGAFIDSAALEIYSYYNSVHYCRQGIFSNSANILYKNTVITSQLVGVDYADFDTVHTDPASDYNASIASGAYAAPGAHSLHGVVPADIYVSVVADNENLHIKNIAAVIYDAGIDVSADPNLPVTDDYDGDARVRPDIGADEFQGGATHTATFTLDAIIQTAIDASIVMAAFTPTTYLRGRKRN